MIVVLKEREAYVPFSTWSRSSVFFWSLHCTGPKIWIWFQKGRTQPSLIFSSKMFSNKSFVTANSLEAANDKSKLGIVQVLLAMRKEPSCISPQILKI